MVKTVYVIDDSVSVCFAIERMLRATGLAVLARRAGEAALRDLEQLTPDLVLLDLVLPDIGGLQICSFMRGHPRLASVPVIIISGIVDDEVRSQALRIGAVGVLKKPFATEDLVQMVSQVLSQESTPLPRPALVQHRQAFAAVVDPLVARGALGADRPGGHHAHTDRRPVGMIHACLPGDGHVRSSFMGG